MAHPFLLRLPGYLVALLLTALPLALDLECYDPTLSIQLAVGGPVLALLAVLALPGFRTLKLNRTLVLALVVIVPAATTEC